ncbi:uncharacterized protein LOC135220157 [Macrobrachium nipponense]|uniref:uncharacterized protein LOC135220157 n=1 Tax=Macrobrachium nipponense TaxID=159736 RepID=UPI0030C81299
MALQILTLVAVSGLVAATSVSHVSFSFGNNAPITYEVRPDSSHASPYPPPKPKHRKPTPPPKYAKPSTTTTAPKYESPTPRTYPTTAPPSHSAYTPPELTYPPTTATPAPTYPPTTTPAQTTTPEQTYAPTTTTTTTTKAPVYHLQPAYLPRPSYHLRPSYHPRPAPSYHPAPSYSLPKVPSCVELTNATWCLEDEEYPEYEIKHAIQYHLDNFNLLYADVADLDAEKSVDVPDAVEEETYLCPSETSYIRPLRAQNTDGIWRIVINDIKVHYKTFTQTTRIEECLTAGEECPKVPMCYESKCLQKSAYHRFLVYDPYDLYFPFAIETFKLPASCACLLGGYTIDH